MSTFKTSEFNKNVGPFLAFNEHFFTKHQRVLLWLLNAPILKYWSRWILRIHNDCSFKTRITGLAPNRFSWGDRLVTINGHLELERTTDFRTHPKFGKRIYYAFRPIWWALHFWDWALADRFVPAWSYGFSTLTVYPNAHPETVSVDGYVARESVNQTLTNIRAGAGTAHGDNNSILLTQLDASGTTNQFTGLYRGLVFFDTSALTASATVSAVTLSVWGTETNNGLGSPAYHIASGNAASNTAIADSDFAQANFGTTSFGNVAYAGFDGTNTTYTSIILNANGIAAVSLTGVSKFSTQLSWDINNNFNGSWLNGGNSYMTVAAADTAGTTSDPKLVITYTAAVDVTASAGVVALLAAIQSPVISGAANVAANVQTASFTILPATFSDMTNVVISASVQVLTASTQAVTAVGAALVAVTVQTLTFSTNAVAFVLDTLLSVAVLVLTFVLNAPTKIGAFYQDKFSSRGTDYDDKYNTRNH